MPFDTIGIAFSLLLFTLCFFSSHAISRPLLLTPHAAFHCFIFTPDGLHGYAEFSLIFIAAAAFAKPSLRRRQIFLRLATRATPIQLPMSHEPLATLMIRLPPLPAFDDTAPHGH